MNYVKNKYIRENDVIVKEFQIQLVNQIVNQKHSLLILPTGSGKTTIAKLILAQLLTNNAFIKKIIFVAPTNILVAQQYVSFKKSCKNLTLVHYIDAKQLVDDEPVIYFMTGHLLKLHSHLFKQVEVLFIDEIHNTYLNGPYEQIISHFNQSIIIGLSATINKTKLRLLNRLLKKW